MSAAEKMQKSQEELKEHARLMALFEMQEAAERKKEAQKRLIEEIKQRCLFVRVLCFCRFTLLGFFFLVLESPIASLPRSSRTGPTWMRTSAQMVPLYRPHHVSHS